MTIDYSKYGGELQNGDTDYSKYGGEVESSSNNFFKDLLNSVNNKNKSLAQINPDLVDPKKMAPAALQAGGIAASIMQPETLALKAIAPNIPKLMNLLLRGGAQFGYGAVASPDDPIAGGVTSIAAPLALKGLLKAGGSLYKTGKNFLTDLSPYEEAVQKSSKDAEEASLAAAPVKPGLYEKPKSDLENIENKIGKYINVEGDHGVNFSRGLNKRVNSIESFWGNSYKDFLNKIKNKTFNMPPQEIDPLNYDMQEIVKRIKAGANPKTVVQDIQKESSNSFFQHIQSKAPTASDTDASVFLSKFKDFRDALSGLKQDLKSPKYGSVEKDQIKKAIEKSQVIKEQVDKTLETGLGEFKPEYDWLNKGYSEQVYPLRENPIAQNAKIQKMPKDILNNLRTDEPGMPLVRQLVKEDPELLKNVIGQRYLQKTSSIHAPNELTREFLDEMPEFKNLLNQKEDLLEQATKRKNISLKEKIKVEKELKNIRAAKSKATTRLKYGAIGAGSLIGAPYGLKYLTNLFSSND